MTAAVEQFPIWAEIDLSAINHNLSEVKRKLDPGTGVIAVVKANAYGHGLEQVAHSLDTAGADAFGVARLSEAVALRESGIKKEILVFGYTPPEATGKILRHKLTQTVFSLSYAQELNEKASNLGESLKVHIKVDTGMGRLGVVPSQLEGKKRSPDCEKDQMCAAVRGICSLSNLDARGIYTHFAASDAADKTSPRRQLALFQDVLAMLDANDIEIPVKHAANSGAVIDIPEAYFDMVRPGIMLYGLYPSEDVDHEDIKLRPGMHLKARITQLKDVPAGFKVSYGETHSTPRPTKLATIPIGYADGYSRKLSSAGVMLVKGQRAPVVGRVCMDQTIIDVGHIEGVKRGDEVVIIGSQGNETVSADEMANQLETINYEIVSTLMARVPRVYI